MRFKILILLAIPIALMTTCGDPVPGTKAQFEVTITNVSSAGPDSTSLSEGVFFTQKGGTPLFFKGKQAYDNGLETLAEEGLNRALRDSLQKHKDVNAGSVGVFGLIRRGDSETFEVSAEYGDYFNFATMLVNSNDLFYSFDEEGILLFKANGDPVSGNFTSKIWLWDAGTEENEKPGGNNQPWTGLPETGEPDPDNTVRLFVNSDFIRYAHKSKIIKIEISVKKQP